MKGGSYPPYFYRNFTLENIDFGRFSVVKSDLADFEDYRPRGRSKIDFETSISTPKTRLPSPDSSPIFDAN